jgi:hypothetical protein
LESQLETGSFSWEGMTFLPLTKLALPSKLRTIECNNPDMLIES